MTEPLASKSPVQNEPVHAYRRGRTKYECICGASFVTKREADEHIKRARCRSTPPRCRTPPLSLTCVPEWCSQERLMGAPIHDHTCPDYAMESMTKGEYVTLAEAIATQAIDAYKFMLEDGFTPDESKEQALAEVEEASICHAGIGSCGRGWCKHS